MWKDIVISVLAIAVSLALVIGMGMHAQACEDNKCSFMFEKWKECYQLAGRKNCYYIKRRADEACGYFIKAVDKQMTIVYNSQYVRKLCK